MRINVNNSVYFCHLLPRPVKITVIKLRKLLKLKGLIVTMSKSPKPYWHFWKSVDVWGISIPSAFLVIN